MHLFAVACYKGHKNSGFYVKTALSPDSQLLLSGSADHNAYIWEVGTHTAQSGQPAAAEWIS